MIHEIMIPWLLHEGAFSLSLRGLAAVYTEKVFKPPGCQQPYLEVQGTYSWVVTLLIAQLQRN